MNSKGYGNLSFPTLLIERVARRIDAKTLQFPSVGDIYANTVTFCFVSSLSRLHVQNIYLARKLCTRLSDYIIFG